MARRRKVKSSSKPCITPSGKRVSRKKTGKHGCPKGSRPASKSRRKKRR